MRRLLLVFIIGSALTTLSGCRYHQHLAVEVDADGHGVFAFRQGLDDEAVEVLEDAGFTVDEYFAPLIEPEPGEPGAERRFQGDGITGVEYAIPFESWAEAADIVSDALGAGATLGPDPDHPDRFTFSADLSVVAADLEGNLLAVTGQDPDHPAVAAAGGSIDRDDLAEAVTIQFRLRLPGRVVDHDADRETADGTLVWDVFPGEPDRVGAVSEVADEASGSSGSFPLIAGAGTGLASAALLARRRRRGRSIHPPSRSVERDNV